MKQKDIALIIIAAFLAGVVSLLISKAIFTSSKERSQQVEVVEPISTEFKQPDKRVFNQNAINPTKLIQIGPSNNQTPLR